MKMFASVLAVLLLSTSVYANKDKSKSPSKSTTAASPPPVQESYFADFEYEIQSMLTGGGIQSLKKGGETSTIISAQAAATKIIKNNIQAGAEVSFYNESAGGGSSYFEIMGVGVYNFDNNLKQSIYAKAGLGMMNVINDKYKNESKLGIMVGGGKRIPIMDKIAYTPELRIILVDGGTRFEIQALNFSVFW